MIPRDIEALIAFVDSRQDVPHKWGRAANDCVGYALDAIEAQTGVRIAPELNWTSQASALRVLRVFGSLEAAFDAHFERVAPAFAHRGDIAFAPAQPVRGQPLAIAEGPFAYHPAVIEGSFLVGPGERGNRRLPRSVMTIAWSIVRPKATTGV